MGGKVTSMHGTMSSPCIQRKEKNTPDTHLDGRLERTIDWNIHPRVMGFWEPKGGVAHMGSSF